MTDDHCPSILGNPRLGFWVACRCGWTSKPMTTRTGASVAWALHVKATR